VTRARQWWLRAIAPAAGSLLGCAVVSTHAIRGELPVTLDPALAGAWRAIDDDGEGSDADRFTFESHGDHYVLAIAGEDEVYEVTTARLGGERYANAVEIGDESGAVALFRYRVDGDRLRIAALDRDAVARYAARGELAVEGDDAKPASPLVIKSGRAALEAFLLEHDPRELFPEPKGYALRITER
jgi:hypothetical protein